MDNYNQYEQHRLTENQRELEFLQNEYRQGRSNPDMMRRMEELQREAQWLCNQIAMKKQMQQQQMQQQQMHQMGYPQMRQPTNPYVNVQPQMGGHQMGYPQMGQPTNPYVNVQPQMGGQQMGQPQMGQQMNMRPQNPYVNAPQPKKQSDVETTIGKNVMGIFASILIFISLIFLGAVALPMLSEYVKMILMYVISLTFAGIGMFLVHKNSKNKLYLSIAGCGAGAIYISIIQSYAHFEIFNSIAVYVGILIWAVLVGVLSRFKSQIFLIIGQIGVAISILFGAVAYEPGEKGEMDFMLLILFFAVAELVFVFTRREREYEKNVVNIVSMMVSIGLMFITYVDIHAVETPYGYMALILLPVVTCLPMLLGFVYYIPNNENAAFFGISNSIFSIMLFAMLAERSTASTIIACVTAVVLMISLEVKFYGVRNAKGKELEGKVVFQVILLISLMMLLLEQCSVSSTYVLAPITLGFMLYGYLGKNKAYKILSIVGYVVTMLSANTNWITVSICSVLFVVALILIQTAKHDYALWEKLTIYPIFFVVECYFIDSMLVSMELQHNEMVGVLVPLIPIAVHMCMLYIPAIKRHPILKQDEVGYAIEMGVINIILILWTAVNMILADEMPSRIVAVVVGCIPVIMNSIGLIRHCEGTWASIYVGLKYAFYLLMALIAFDAPLFLMSVEILLLAVFCITCGFYLEKRKGNSQKGVRIVGLILALIGILKLILIDIEYNSLLVRAISFFVSGLLCFGISFLYNRVDKKIADDIRNETQSENRQF